MCIDFRGLNEITIKNNTPMPFLDQQLDRTHGATVFSTLDCEQAFRQIRVAERDRHKTAFRGDGTLYEWNVMPFGLCNAPATFVTAMQQSLGGLEAFCVVYMDDILVFSATVDAHVRHLRQVLDILRRDRWYVNPAKCHFFQHEVAYLGHIVSARGIAANPDKTAAVRDFPAPKTRAQLLSFLGMCGWMRKFVPGYARVVEPLQALAPDQADWQWGEDQQRAFDAIKAALTSPPVLAQRDPSKPLQVYTDASGFAIGAALFQGEGDDRRPVAYASRQLIPRERNWSTTDQEMAAIMFALDTWRHYLIDRPFSVYTDHRALTHFFSQPTLNSRQRGWQERCGDYDFDIQYISGPSNQVADALSRNPDFALVNAIVAHDFDPACARQLLIEGGARDPKYAAALRDPPTGHSVRDGVLVASHGGRERLVMPNDEDAKRGVLRILHDDPFFGGHFGQSKTLARVRHYFFWPRAQADVEAYVRACVSCQATKPSNRAPAGLLRPMPVADGPRSLVALDFMGPLPKTRGGNTGIMVIVDLFSKFARFVPIKSQCPAPEAAAAFFSVWVKDFGLPDTLITDRDSRFTGNFWRALMANAAVRHCKTTAYHPQTDGQTERTNRTLLAYLRHFVDDRHDDWDDHLANAESAYNHVAQDSTGLPPARLMLGYAVEPPFARLLSAARDNFNPASADMVAQYAQDIKTAKANILAAQRAQKRAYDKRRSDVSFSVGDLVLLNAKNQPPTGPSTKFSKRWLGPFKVAAVSAPDVYTLEMPASFAGHPTFHVNLLKPFHAAGLGEPPPAVGPNDGTTALEPPDEFSRPGPVRVTRGGSFWVPERIVDEGPQPGRRGTFYRINWHGWQSSDDTWESATRFRRSHPELVAEWEATRGGAPAP